MNLKKAVLYRKEIYITRWFDEHINRNYKGEKYKIDKSFIKVDKIEKVNINTYIYEIIINKFINHHFDYLGSGWTKVNYELKDNIKERILKKDYKFANKIYNLISEDYKHKLIDWQFDYKNQRRFSEKVWAKNIFKFDNSADVKLPWEISRFYHLVPMAIYAVHNKEDKNQIILEFKNQILDFITFNPVKMGVNWSCSMEVAIRAINILLAFDILKQIDEGKIFDDKFHNILSNSIYDHGKYIADNLEKNDVFSGNHYLANLAGLIYIFSYLNENMYINKLLKFSIEEFVKEFINQYNEDGSNKEASTYYHRLSTEIALYTTPFILKHINNNKLNLKICFNNKIYNDYMIRLKKSVEFLVNISKNNSEMPQIGDNDSGRIVKLSYQGNIDNEEFEENELLVNQIISLADGMFENLDVKNQKILNLEKVFIEGLIDKKIIAKSDNNTKTLKSGKIKDIDNNKLIFTSEEIIDLHKYRYILNVDSLEEIYYDDFGIYILKNDDFYLSFRLGNVGQNGRGGHAHNDNLSITLRIKNDDILLDPGSYVYTGNRELRNLYRSNKAHNNPYVEGIEYNIFTGTFSLQERSSYVLEKFEKNLIRGLITIEGIIIERTIYINEKYIKIVDKSNVKIINNFSNNVKVTKGYGKLLNST